MNRGFRIADFRLVSSALRVFNSAIPNPQSEILKGWPTRPGSHKLGAKWVEVRKRRAPAESDSKMKANLKRPATTVEGSLEINESFTLRT